MSAAARVLSGGLGRSAGRIAPPTFKAVTALRAAPIRTASAAESVAAIAASARILTPGTVGCVTGAELEEGPRRRRSQKMSMGPVFFSHLTFSSPFPHSPFVARHPSSSAMRSVQGGR
jgi:hypothetical protein